MRAGLSIMPSALLLRGCGHGVRCVVTISSVSAEMASVARGECCLRPGAIGTPPPMSFRATLIEAA